MIDKRWLNYETTLRVRLHVSTRVRICVGIDIRFRERFVQKQNGDPINCFVTHSNGLITHFSQKNQKLTSWTPLASNCTPNRTGIRVEITLVDGP
jgi:hypothetical protein